MNMSPSTDRHSSSILASSDAIKRSTVYTWAVSSLPVKVHDPRILRNRSRWGRSGALCCYHSRNPTFLLLLPRSFCLLSPQSDSLRRVSPKTLLGKLMTHMKWQARDLQARQATTVMGDRAAVAQISDLFVKTIDKSWQIAVCTPPRPTVYAGGRPKFGEREWSLQKQGPWASVAWVPK